MGKCDSVGCSCRVGGVVGCQRVKVPKLGLGIPWICEQGSIVMVDADAVCIKGNGASGIRENTNRKQGC